MIENREKRMMSTECCPVRERTLQQVAGMSASMCQLCAAQEMGWRVQSASTVTVLCMQGLLRVDIDQPMYSVDLSPGEIYVVPANLAYRLAARSVDTSFLLLK